jgi:hypothetical protein
MTPPEIAFMKDAKVMTGEELGKAVGFPVRPQEAFYLAARYSQHPEMRGYRDQLQDHGYLVTSRWIDLHGGELVDSASMEKLGEDPVRYERYAKVDLEDLDNADTVISFTSADRGGKGGRHVEYGYALAAGKNVVIIGPRENIFHTLGIVSWYPDWDSFAKTLSS